MNKQRLSSTIDPLALFFGSLKFTKSTLRRLDAYEYTSMEALNYTRDATQHHLHMLRIKNQRTLIDTKTPDSLGLKHLAVRPKKMQLIEDRRQMIAYENLKLMERMAKIMSTSPQQIEHLKTPGKNEAIRRREAEKVTLENRQIMDRLHAVAPVLSSAKLEHDFTIHQRDLKTLQKRIMKPRRRLDSQSGLKLTNSTLEMPQDLDTMSISSIAEFRKQFIGSRKLSSLSPSGASKNGFQTLPLTATQDSFMLFHSER